MEAARKPIKATIPGKARAKVTHEKPLMNNPESPPTNKATMEKKNLNLSCSISVRFLVLSFFSTVKELSIQKKSCQPQQKPPRGLFPWGLDASGQT